MDLTPTLVQDNERAFSCTFTPDDLCVHAHFPGQPVLPGSFIIGLCVQIIQTDFAYSTALHITGFSFRQFASPGCYDLRVRKEDNTFVCTFAQASAVFARGRIMLCS